MPDEVNHIIGRYRVIREIGRGGMAVVYRAYDPNVGRNVAIKVLPREFMHDPLFRTRFERETQVIARLEHAAIVPVYDFGAHEGQPYLVMRYMEGGSLAQRLTRGAMTLGQTAPIIRRIARALDYSHQRGVIHRDLKPGNILFDNQDNAYLSDFGIAKLAQSTTSLTGNAVIGTPAYMSPEQVHGETEIDGRSDVYALGAILFEMLAGTVPYKGATTAKQLMAHILSPVPRIRNIKADLPPDSDQLIERAMAKDREARFQNAMELALAVEQLATTGTLPPALLEPVPGEKTIPDSRPDLGSSATAVGRTIVEAGEATEVEEQTEPKPVPQAVPQPVPQSVPPPKPFLPLAAASAGVAKAIGATGTSDSANIPSATSETSATSTSDTGSRDTGSSGMGGAGWVQTAAMPEQPPLAQAAGAAQVRPQPKAARPFPTKPVVAAALVVVAILALALLWRGIGSSNSLAAVVPPASQTPDLAAQTAQAGTAQANGAAAQQTETALQARLDTLNATMAAIGNIPVGNDMTATVVSSILEEADAVKSELEKDVAEVQVTQVVAAITLTPSGFTIVPVTPPVMPGESTGATTSDTNTGNSTNAAGESTGSTQDFCEVKQLSVIPHSVPRGAIISIDGSSDCYTPNALVTLSIDGLIVSVFPVGPFSVRWDTSSTLPGNYDVAVNISQNKQLRDTKAVTIVVESSTATPTPTPNANVTATPTTSAPLPISTRTPTREVGVPTATETRILPFPTATLTPYVPPQQPSVTSTSVVFPTVTNTPLPNEPTITPTQEVEVPTITPTPITPTEEPTITPTVIGHVNRITLRDKPGGGSLVLVTMWLGLGLMLGYTMVGNVGDAPKWWKRRRWKE